MLAEIELTVFNESMSEKSERNKRFAYEKTFFEVIDASETRDQGITQFEYYMEETREELLEMFKGQHLTDDTVIENAIDELNDEWRYEDSVATVGGRLYLTAEEVIDELPDEWGEAQYDDRNRPYYFFDEHQQLISQGVTILPDFNPATGTVEDIHIVYLFSHEDDPEYTVFQAYPGELSYHEYDTPTPEEAEIRLERHWPAEYEVVQRLIEPDLQANLPQRMDALARHLQQAMQASDDLRELVTIVINHRLALDQTQPYIATIAQYGTFSVYDGAETPYDKDTEGDWLRATAERPLTVLGHRPAVSLSAFDDGTVRPCFIMEVYNDEDGDDPEYITAEAHDIIAFRSTRATRSLAERALYGMKDDGDALRDVADDIREDVTVLPVLELEQPDTMPALYRDMETVEHAILSLVEKVGARELYPTAEAAHAASQQYIQEFFDDYSDAYRRIAQRHTLLFSGDGMFRANAQTAEQPGESFSTTYDVNALAVPIEDGDAREGRIEGVFGTIDTVVDEDGDVEGYTPDVFVYVSDRQSGIVVVDEHNVPVVSAEAKLMAIIQLNSTTEVTIPNLEAYREFQGVMAEADTAYKGTSLREKLTKLSAALFNTVDEKFDALRRVSHLTAINDLLRDAVATGAPETPAMNVLESLLVGRPVVLKGGIAQRNEQGEVSFNEAGYEVAELYGIIVDVRRDILGDEIVLALQPQHTSSLQVGYVPLSTITRFMF